MYFFSIIIIIIYLFLLLQMTGYTIWDKKEVAT